MKTLLFIFNFKGNGMKKFIIKLLFLVVISALMLAPINYLFCSKNGRYIYKMMNEMYECDKNIEVLFLGSSHVYRSYDTKISDEILGVKSYNAGSSSQGMNTSYYLLKEINQYHDLQTVYLDTYYGMANIPEDDGQVFTISDYMRPGKNKIELLLSSGGIETLVKGYMLFQRNLNLNIVDNIKSNFTPLSDYSSVQYDNEEYRGEGFVYSFEVVNAEDENVYTTYAGGADFSQGTPVSDLYYEYLMKIIQYCADNNIKLVLVNQPMPKKTTDYVKDYNNYVQYIKGIAELNNIEYWNFDLYKEELGLTMADYKDGGHLNGEGAEKYTEFFCKFILLSKNEDFNMEQYFYQDYK